MAIMAAFFISCFALFLVLWLRAGGATPLAPAKYRVHLLMPQAKGLGPHSDVRVSGVTVGHVVEITAAREGGRAIPRADILVDLERPFAPLRADANAMLRSKSILGEAYVAISLGSPSAPLVPEGGTLARSQGRDSVSPDQIFETYDRPTRAALRAWLQTEGPAARRHGQDLNAAVGSLRPWVADAGDLLAIVDRQGSDVARLLRDGGTIS